MIRIRADMRLKPGREQFRLRGSVRCRFAEDGIDTVGLKHRVDPGIQLVRISRQ